MTSICNDRVQAVMNQHQKYHKAKDVTLQLASLASEGGMDQFKARLALLRILRDRWTKGEEVMLGFSGI